MALFCSTCTLLLGTVAVSLTPVAPVALQQLLVLKKRTCWQRAEPKSSGATTVRPFLHLCVSCRPSVTPEQVLSFTPFPKPVALHVSVLGPALISRQLAEKHRQPRWHTNLLLNNGAQTNFACSRTFGTLHVSCCHTAVNPCCWRCTRQCLCMPYGCACCC